MIIYMKKACMFPGQGVQFTGMMKEEYCNKYSKYIKSADDILGYSIVDICNNKDRAQMLSKRFIACTFTCNGLLLQPG